MLLWKWLSLSCCFFAPDHKLYCILARATREVSSAADCSNSFVPQQNFFFSKNPTKPYQAPMRIPFFRRGYHAHGPSRRRRPNLSWEVLVLCSIVLLWSSHVVTVVTANRATSYYDILGIPKTADDKTIKKAYRKLAIKHRKFGKPS